MPLIQAVRSCLFYLAFFIITTLMLVLGLPLLLGPRSWAMKALKLHGKVVIWLFRIIVGAKLEVRGLEHIPQGAFLVASKHQSAFETFALPALLKDPAIIMKKELMKIPIYGQFSNKFEMIPVDRKGGGKALRQLLKTAKQRAEANREIIIFPEGTRTKPFAGPNYQSGIVMLYDQLGVPCVSVALNTGLFWPRRGWPLKSGTIIIEFLPLIEPGLNRADFKARLIEAVQTNSDRLCEETLRDHPHLAV